MKKQTGFTLIELIVVIVILAILAVTAAPKFLNFTADARISTLNAVKGSLQGANSMIRGKAEIQGVAKDALSTVCTGVLNSGTCNGGDTIKVKFGSVADDYLSFIPILDMTMSVPGTSGPEEWLIALGTGSYIGTVAFIQKGSPSLHPEYNNSFNDSIECYLEYTPAAAVDIAPVYRVLSADC